MATPNLPGIIIEEGGSAVARLIGVAIEASESAVARLRGIEIEMIPLPSFNEFPLNEGGFAGSATPSTNWRDK